MPDLIDRTEIIKERIDTMLLDTIGFPVSTMPLDAWVDLELGTGEQFGFLWPRPFEDTLLVAYCPDIIAVQTCWLDDPQFEAYMELVEFMLCRHLALGVMDLDERRQQVESELWDLRPEAMEFLSHIQMQILDMMKGDET